MRKSRKRSREHLFHHRCQPRRPLDKPHRLWKTLILLVVPLLSLDGKANSAIAASDNPARAALSENRDSSAPDQPEQNTEEDLPASDLEAPELLLFEDIPVVVSAARQAQPINLSSVPVTVITAEDIHYSGLTSLPEILQFHTGIDYFMADRNHPAIGVRGFNSDWSDRTLVLVDGRTVNNLAFGGMEWIRLPVALEDIDRIEIVRGPAGAAWGANAFTGVINIITREPGKVKPCRGRWKALQCLPKRLVW